MANWLPGPEIRCKSFSPISIETHQKKLNSRGQNKRNLYYKLKLDRMLTDLGGLGDFLALKYLKIGLK